MTESVFSRIYTYRERENKNSKENFLIEILAHCLLTDEKLLRDFLSLVDVDWEEGISVDTQNYYLYGRPDLEVNLKKSKTCILIECKIEHFERPNQLEDYKKILLEKEVKSRHLIYLTKYYEQHENENSDVHFHHLRWLDIYNIISDENTEITLELEKYLNDENMTESKNFDYHDITALLTVSNTISKMDEVIDSVKDHFEKKIGLLAKDSARSTRLQYNYYVAYHIVTKPDFRVGFDIGFMWWHDEVYLGIRIYIPKSTKFTAASKVSDIITASLGDWDLYETDNYFEIIKQQALSQFILEEEDQVPAMRRFLVSCIDDLASVKKKNPGLFK